LGRARADIAAAKSASSGCFGVTGSFKATNRPGAWAVATIVVLLAAAGVGGVRLVRGHVKRADAAARTAPKEPGLVGFYVGWDPNARTSLAGHVGALDTFAPMWVTVRGAEAELVPEDDPDTQALLARRPRPPRIMPIFTNAHDNIWDAKSAEQTILDDGVRARVNQGLIDLAKQRGLSGYIFDFEQLGPKAAAGFADFLKTERTQLGAQGLQVWAVAPADPSVPLEPLAGAADAIVVMAYDECWGSSNPGPVGGADWVQAMLAQRLKGLDPRRVVIALASYGYDWPKRQNAKVISIADATALAAQKGAQIARDPASANTTFSYTDDNGRRHDVWMVDGPAFGLERRIAATFHPRAVALWRLGLEDPALWTGAGPRLKPPAAPTPGAPLPHPCDPLTLPPA
jgi:spore germination protein YaaH